MGMASILSDERPSRRCARHEGSRARCTCWLAQGKLLCSIGVSILAWRCCRSCLQDLTTNLYRIHDWRLEICDGQPISKNVGFSWHPGMYTLIANDAEIVRHILKDEFNKYTKPECLYDPFFFYFQDLIVICRLHRLYKWPLTEG